MLSNIQPLPTKYFPKKHSQVLTVEACVPFKRPLRKKTHLFTAQMFIMPTSANTVLWENRDAGTERVVVRWCQGHEKRADLSQAWEPTASVS